MRVRDRVAIGWIDPGHVDTDFALSILSIDRHRRDRVGAVHQVTRSGQNALARNDLVARFLDTNDAWLLMLDTDQRLTVAAFDLLVNAAHDSERPILAGLVFGAQPSTGPYPTPEPCIYRTIDDGLYESIDDYPANALVPVDAAGTGCLLVHRDAFERIRAAAGPNEGDRYCWFQDGPVAGHWFGEDFIFCRRAIALGYPIHAHTGAVSPHRKSYWLDEQHHQAQIAPGVLGWGGAPFDRREARPRRAAQNLLPGSKGPVSRPFDERSTA